MNGLVDPGTWVVIVDDDVDVRQSMCDALALEGYAVHPVATPEVALSAIRNGIRPALIIMDLWLPGIGSAGFIRSLRASEHAAVPVLIVSGAGALESVALEVDGVLRKPPEMTSLVRAVDKLVGRSHTPTPTIAPYAVEGDRPRPRRVRSAS